MTNSRLGGTDDTARFFRRALTSVDGPDIGVRTWVFLALGGAAERLDPQTGKTGGWPEGWATGALSAVLIAVLLSAVLTRLRRTDRRGVCGLTSGILVGSRLINSLDPEYDMILLSTTS